MGPSEGRILIFNKIRNTEEIRRKCLKIGSKVLVPNRGLPFRQSFRSWPYLKFIISLVIKNFVLIKLVLVNISLYLSICNNNLRDFKSFVLFKIYDYLKARKTNKLNNDIFIIF